MARKIARRPTKVFVRTPNELQVHLVAEGDLYLAIKQFMRPYIAKGYKKPLYDTTNRMTACIMIHPKTNEAVLITACKLYDYNNTMDK